MTQVAEVRLWGRVIGAVALNTGQKVAQFEFDRSFAGSGIQISPLTMPLSQRIYRFPELASQSFHGLPGLLADSVPDRFGNALIDAWLARQGRSPDTFSIIERLCYIGERGMGALEYQPAIGPNPRSSEKVDIQHLVILASQILSQRADFETILEDRPHAFREILRGGTSAGGARAKAVIAWNPETDEVRSDQVDVEEGFEHWLLKLDGVEGNRDKELNDPQGFGAIEYAYALMALQAGVQMTACRLMMEGERRHFMTKRFDRTQQGAKIHMLSLAGLAHYDLNQAGAYSYEQAMQCMHQLALPMSDIEQMFLRMIFNIVARNQDDHVKNISFLMDRHGTWTLAPAYDVTYSFNPNGQWTAQHQMTINGKRNDFTIDDLKACARSASLRRNWVNEALERVTVACNRWREFAHEAGVDGGQREQIEKTFRFIN